MRKATKHLLLGVGLLCLSVASSACGDLIIPATDTSVPTPDVTTDTTIIGQKCTTNAECATGTICRIGTCDLGSGTCTVATDPETCYIASACYNRDQEPPGDGCKVCDPDLNQQDFVNKICPVDEECITATGECSGPTVTAKTMCGTCAVTADCDTGLTCETIGSGSFCSQTCTTDAECGTGFVCADIDGAQLCVLPTGGCSAEGTECTVTGDCDDLNPCTLGTCNVDVCTFTFDDTVSVPCYTGDAATRTVGICSDGTSTCSGGTFGGCVGDVLPEAADACGDNIDNDCDGTADQDCNFTGVDLSPVNAVTSGAIGATSDILNVTFDATPIGPASPDNSPIKVDLGIYSTQF